MTEVQPDVGATASSTALTNAYDEVRILPISRREPEHDNHSRLGSKSEIK